MDCHGDPYLPLLVDAQWGDIGMFFENFEIFICFLKRYIIFFIGALGYLLVSAGSLLSVRQGGKKTLVLGV